MKTLTTLALLGGSVAVANAATIWQNDWRTVNGGAVAANTTFTNSTFDGTAVVGSQDLDVISGNIRNFNSAGVGGLDLIQTTNAGTFEGVIKTDSLYGANTTYTLDFIIGTGSGSNRFGEWFVEFGTYDGTTFTALASVDSGDSSYTFSLLRADGTSLADTENFSDNTNDQASIFGDLNGGDATYNVGGRLQTVTFDSTDSVNGEEIAFRFGVSNSDRFSGFSDMALDATVVPEPSSTALLGLAGLGFLLRRRK